MGRLRAMPARLAQLAPMIKRAADAEGHSPIAEPWRRWYSLKRWRDLRLEVLARDLFTCRMCRRLEADTSQLVADHIVQHRGDPGRFWAEGNLQTLCAPCHNRLKQAAERAARPGS
jgi:5-methylcytosine-specific restriction enzyme A